MDDPRLPALLSLLGAQRDDDHRRRMIELARTGAAPLDRNHFEPGHFTASGFVAHPNGASILLIEHRRLERWLQPGGHIDPDDADTASAAEREVREETGVARLHRLSEGLLAIDIHEIPAAHGEPMHLHHDLMFAFRARDDELTPTPEVLAARWVDFADVAASTSDPATLRGVARLERLLDGA